jgi:hypothetical protein
MTSSKPKLAFKVHSLIMMMISIHLAPTPLLPYIKNKVANLVSCVFAFVIIAEQIHDIPCDELGHM